MRILSIILIFYTLVSAEWDPTIRRNLRLNEFITQISSRYNVPVTNDLYQEPQKREEVAQFIQYAIDSLNLTKGELEDAKLLLRYYNGDRVIVGKANEKGRFNLNLNLTGDADLGTKDSLHLGFKGIINPSINGFISGISYTSGFSVWTEARNDTIWVKNNYQPYNGNPYNLFGREDSGNVRASDMFRVGTSWDWGLSEWDVGVDQLKSGPAVKNPLILNITTNNIFYTRLKLKFKWFTYTHIFGIPQSIRGYNRFLYYHRVDIPLWDKRINIGVNGAIVYGSTADSATTAPSQNDPLSSYNYNITRTINPVYLIPFVPFAFAEHFSGDRDNVLMSFDFSIRAPTDFYWYFEFLIDDISSPLTIFSDDWGNKWGITAGGKWFGNVKGKNLTISSEYTRVEPWVYTHFYGTANRYSNFGSLMGAHIGPNSDQLWLETKFQLNQKNRFSIAFTNHRYNHEQRGGDFKDVFINEATAEESNGTLTPDKETKVFLDGNVTKEQIYAINWELLPYHLYEMSSTLSYSSLRGFQIRLIGNVGF